MNIRPFLLLSLAFLISCKPGPVNQSHSQEAAISQNPDKEILGKIFGLCSGDQEATSSVLMVKVGRSFLQTPYVANTLEAEDEQLIINLREMDCTTFAENCLAITRTIQSGNQSYGQFCSELQNIRYRNGKLEGYPSRLHYFCDWIFNNQQKSLLKDVSQDIALTAFRKEINFMSTHPDSYRQLTGNDSLIAILAEQERRISQREMFFIPTSQIGEYESQLMDGDIVGICTEIDGLAITHVGILIRQEGHIHLMHASSGEEEVVISANTLEEYLRNRKSATGIMLARPV